MASSAKELDLNPDVYIGLTYPIKSGENLDFELTKRKPDIKLGDIFDKKRFTVLNKELIPGADFMCEVSHSPWKTKMQSSSSYFKNESLYLKLPLKE